MSRYFYTYIAVLALLLVSSIVPLAAQDVVFSHLLSAPQYTNPAFAGAFGRYHSSVAARSQFTASPTNYNAIYADADMYIPSWNSSLGFYIMNERASGGVFQTTSFALAYGYALRLSELLTLRPALQAVYYLQQRNPQNLIFPDMVGGGGTAYYPYMDVSTQRLDFSAGLLFQHPDFETGIAVQHLGGTTTDVLTVYGDYSLKITFHGQASIALAGDNQLLPLNEWTAFENIVLLPQAKYVHQSDFNYLVAGAAVRSGGLFAGVALKTTLQNETYLGVASLGLDSRTLKVGYSFDFIFTGGNLRGWDSGSHEFFLHYAFGSSDDQPRRKSKSKRRLNPACGCPY